MFCKTFREGLNRATFPKLRTVDQYQPTLARRRRFVRLECHVVCLPFSCSATPKGDNGYRAPKVPGGCLLDGLSPRNANNNKAPDESGAVPMGSFRACGEWGQGQSPTISSPPQCVIGAMFDAGLPYPFLFQTQRPLPLRDLDSYTQDRAPPMIPFALEIAIT
ncbi:NAD(FAD)-dependent dehydrogenase [Sulfitobacter mediterraneus KCTC 32188]|nr:NAD(FAD)-dependent dehydrogenase [Sulfitobacter mediterraneus KCTC 32188]